MVSVKSTDSPLSATAVVKTPPQGTSVCILACQVMSSCFCRFPVQLKVGVEHLAQRPEKFLSRKVCAFLLWLQLCMFVHVYIVVSYAAGHRKECVTEMVRVKSTDSPLSAMAGVKAPLQGTGVCEITF